MGSNCESIELLDTSTGTTANVLVGCGLNCYSFRPKLGGEPVEVLWSEPDFASGNQRPSGSGIPLMFPFPGRLRGKSLEYQSETYALESGDVMGNAIHGYVLDRPWRVIVQRPAEFIAQFQASVDDAERIDCWPSDYLVTAKYSLRAHTLSLDVTIENPTADRVLPFGFGTHPYFRIPLGAGAAEQCTVRVPAAKYWQMAEMLPTGEKNRCESTHDLSGGKPFVEMQLDDVLTDLVTEDGRVTTQIVDSASGHTVTMTCDDVFTECVVYNPPHREAVCIEPITSVPNAYELENQGVKTGVRTLQRGETFQCNIEIIVS